ncbi:DUF2844 domain-containing protein [Ramlibacter sp. MMS24-I3-19]|uniref:DUF2844 domain-containing protein n=1 Tax=Ramlibacter sp. MMS24-I3-19 TaxID=3416606 RepID=UPI003CFEDF54
MRSPRLLAAIALAAAGPAFAALGGAPNPPPPGAAAATTQQAVTAAGAAYSHVQRQLETGTVLHEFVDSGGTVFAVAWSGPFLPDLRELLGASFPALQESAARGRTSALSISRPDLVLVSAGHMRGFEGRAWLPTRLPAGFDPRQIP